MTRKPKRIPPSRLPRCDGADRLPPQDDLAHGTWRLCWATAAYRVEWTAATTKAMRGGRYAWSLCQRQEQACARHLPSLVDRADTDVVFARSPYRDWEPTEVPSPTVTRLKVALDRRAYAHGKTLYIPTETLLTGPVALQLF